MERDMDLIRQLLEEIINEKEYDLIVIPEKFNTPEQYEKDKKIKYHLEIMKQRGLIEYKYLEDYAGIGHFYKLELTWDGQDFYSNVKNDTIWNNTKQHLKSKALTLGEVGFDMLITVVKFKASEFLGIPLD